MKMRKCSSCGVVRPFGEFKRKYKTYKSCNRCSRYKQQYAKSKKKIEPSKILHTLFSCNESIPYVYHQKYKCINQLQMELINDIRNHFISKQKNQN